MTEKAISVFTDGSAHPQLKVGVGAYILITEPLDYISLTDMKLLSGRITFREFRDTSSTKLEVSTVIWALNELIKQYDTEALPRITLYTDSQTVTGLPGRRQKLEAENFISRNKGVPLKNTSLYREFYKLNDKLNFKVVKLKGHTKSAKRSTEQEIFSYLDRSVRGHLRELARKMK